MRTAMPNPVPRDAARVFLAGATGVIGRRLIPLLVAGGHHVTAMTRRPDRAGALRGLGAEPWSPTSTTARRWARRWRRRDPTW